MDAADAMYPCLDADLAEATASNRAVLDLHQMDSSKNDMHIVISSPEKHGDGLDSYVTYCVTTKTTREGYHAREFFVRRRYGDFAWLRRKLEEEAPECIIPSLPEKHALKRLERFTPEFLERRRQGLEKFLIRVTEHLVLSNSPSFKLFLEAKNWELTTAQSKSMGFVDAVGETIWSLAPKATLKQPDPKFTELNSYAATMAKCLADLDAATAKIIKARQDVAADLSEYGPVFHLMSNAEMELCRAFTALGHGMDRLSSAHKAWAQSIDESLGVPVNEYVLYAESVKDTLARRDNVHAEAETMRDELERTRNEKKNAESGGPDRSTYLSSFTSMIYAETPQQRTERITKLDKAIWQLEHKVQKAEEDLGKTNAIVSAEFDRWNGRKREELKTMLKSFTKGEIDYYKKCIAIWEEVIPTIDSL